MFHFLGFTDFTNVVNQLTQTVSSHPGWKSVEQAFISAQPREAQSCWMEVEGGRHGWQTVRPWRKEANKGNTTIRLDGRGIALQSGWIQVLKEAVKQLCNESGEFHSVKFNENAMRNPEEQGMPLLH